MLTSIRQLTIIAIALATAALADAAEPAGAGKTPAPPGANPPVGTGKFWLYEDFESTPVGQVPKGFTKTGMVAVVDDVAHSGTHSLRMEPAANGPRRITAKGEAITALGGTHWGRLYF